MIVGDNIGKTNKTFSRTIKSAAPNRRVSKIARNITSIDTLKVLNHYENREDEHALSTNPASGSNRIIGLSEVANAEEIRLKTLYND